MKNSNDNSSENIKSIATALFAVSIAYYVITACIIAYRVSDALIDRIIGASAVAAVVLFAIIAIGVFVSWIVYQALCGYSNIIEYSAEQADYYKSIYERLLSENE